VGARRRRAQALRLRAPLRVHVYVQQTSSRAALLNKAGSFGEELAEILRCQITRRDMLVHKVVRVVRFLSTGERKRQGETERE